MTNGKIKERNTSGGSSEGKGDSAKGVEGGGGRIGFGAMKKDSRTTGNGDMEETGHLPRWGDASGRT